LHVFLDNFKGVAAKRNPLPDPERDVEVSFDEGAGAHIYVCRFSAKPWRFRTPER
jgi:hypothetical protein